MPLPAAHAETLERKLLSNRCYGQILQLIEDGGLLPGEVLSDSELQHWLGVSRTPIREALNRLTTEGLVLTAPQRSTRIAEHSIHELRDDLRMLFGLYELAARWSRPDAQRLATIRQRLIDLRDAIDAGSDARVAIFCALQEQFVAGCDPATAQTMQVVRTRVAYSRPAWDALIPWAAVRILVDELEAEPTLDPARIVPAYARLGAAQYAHLGVLAEQAHWQQRFLAPTATGPRS